MKAYRELYESIKTMRETYTPFVQTTNSDFYGKVNTLYEELRQMRPPGSSGPSREEPIDLLAEEAWDLFCAVQ